jgi:hypothetical protein
MLASITSSSADSIDDAWRTFSAKDPRKQVLEESSHAFVGGTFATS